MSPGDSLSAYELDATGKLIVSVPPSDQGEGALCSPPQNPSCMLGRRRVSLCASGLRLLGVPRGSLSHLLILMFADTWPVRHWW